MLAKDSIKNKSPRRHSLEESNMKIEGVCWIQKIFKLAKESWQAFSSLRLIKISFLERVVRCHRQLLGLGVAPSSTLQCKI
jgi:hypothetical protein